MAEQGIGEWDVNAGLEVAKRELREKIERAMAVKAPWEEIKSKGAQFALAKYPEADISLSPERAHFYPLLLHEVYDAIAKSGTPDGFKMAPFEEWANQGLMHEGDHWKEIGATGGKYTGIGVVVSFDGETGTYQVSQHVDWLSKGGEAQIRKVALAPRDGPSNLDRKQIGLRQRVSRAFSRFVK